MKIGFIITTYDRIDDFLAHLDILKFFPYPYTVIPIWMKNDMPSYFLEEMSKYEHSHYKDGINFRVGPLMGLLDGLETASRLGLDFVVYRNGDDWLFNHDFCLHNFDILNHTNCHVSGYNWLSCNTMQEFALNELYLRVNKFMPTIREAERYFLNSSKRFLCELKVAKWIRSVVKPEEFYRLPGREMEPGIGYEPDTLPMIFYESGIDVPAALPDLIKNNNRFFNRKWQLIGSHDNSERVSYYSEIRSEISYHEQLEKEEHFSRWFRYYSDGVRWNLPIDLMHRDLDSFIHKKSILHLKSLPKSLPKKLLKIRRSNL